MVKYYETNLDIIADKVNFEELVVPKPELVTEINEIIVSLPQKVMGRDKALK